MINTHTTDSEMAQLLCWVSRVPARLAGFIWEAITLTLRLIFERKPAQLVLPVEPVIENVTEAELDETERETRSCVPIPGAVYVMENEEGLRKVGYTTQKVSARRSQIVSATGQKMTVIAAFECEAAWAAEKVLHAVFGDKNVSGEYFKLDDADIAMIPDIIAAVNPANIVKRVKAPKVVTCGACGAALAVRRWHCDCN